MVLFLSLTNKNIKELVECVEVTDGHFSLVVIKGFFFSFLA